MIRSVVNHVIIFPDSICYRNFDMKPEIPVLVALEDNLSRFSSRHITSSSIVSLLVSSFNIFLIILIVRKKY
jgi:hypothetical protein